MPDLWSDLLGCLDVQADDAGYTGPNQALTYHRLFGGQLLAQFIRVAELACPGKAVKSLHVLFPREGKSAEPVRYTVEPHHEGRSFGTLAIVAAQSSGTIATAAVSVHAPEEGPARQSAAPVPGLPDRVAALDLIPWETRAAADLDAPEAGPAEFELWMRTPETDPAFSPALTAYATDLTLIGTALRAADGVSQRDAGRAFVSAVTSHSLWFHRPFRTDQWLLLRQQSPINAGGRTFGRGDVLTAGGDLVASYAQEALLRFVQPSAGQ